MPRRWASRPESIQSCPTTCQDFSHVSLIGHTPNVLIVPADSPYKTLADYIAAARAKPDEIAFGSSGIGSNTHLMGEQLSGLAGVKLKHVPYKGSAPSLQDMLAGAIPSMFDPITTNVPHINAGKVRMLAISSEKRIAMYPDTPTFAEQGFPQMTTSTWVGVSGPKGLAPEVVARLYDELQKAYKAPDVQERFKDVVLLPEDKPMTPAEYARFVGDFAAIWTKVSKDAGISLELTLGSTGGGRVVFAILLTSRERGRGDRLLEEDGYRWRPFIPRAPGRRTLRAPGSRGPVGRPIHPQRE